MMYIIVALIIIIVVVVVAEYAIILSLLDKIDAISRCLEIAENDIEIIKKREQNRQIFRTNDLKFGD